MPAVFRFFSGSKSLLPGLGTGETLDKLESDEALLDNEPNWKKALGNDFEFPVADYSSVSVYLAASKALAKNGKPKNVCDKVPQNNPLHQALLLKFIHSPPTSLPYKLLHSKDMHILAAIIAMQKSTLGQQLIAIKPAETHSKYYHLATTYPDFRKILSNFYLFDMYDPDVGITWPSVEHFFHAHKIQLVFPKRPMTDIHAELSRLEPLKAKSSTSKKQFSMTDGQLQDWDRHVKTRVIKRGLRLKFLESGESSLPFKVLVATCDAVLQHVSRGVSGDAFSLGKHIMEVRQECFDVLRESV
ncbi:UNVERIFIED_CONTAM: hypothetical protein HDU68_002230 [Siphonaria sp. JEL0065]|nr:hypothetical protein HDU68_002230 [Siphonaria sp. JEL0065]